MQTEYEIRVLEVNKEKMIKRLEELGAEKIGEFNQKRYVYNTKPEHPSRWIRLRTNGIITTLTYKDVKKNTIDGTKELEFEVGDFETANEFLEIIGYKNKGYQENNRIQYKLNGIEIDIDTWPMIPTYMEIEAKAEEEVFEIIELLQVDKEKVTALNCKDIYQKIYNINIDEIKELKF